MKCVLSMIILLAISAGGSVVFDPQHLTVAKPLSPGPPFTTLLPETWWQKLLRIAGISAAPTRQRGNEDPPKPGDLYVYSLGRNNDRRLARGNYSSPIFLAGDEKILALTGTSIVRVPILGGAAETFPNDKHIVKLVGQSLDDRNQVLVLTNDGSQTSVGILSLSDWSVTVIPHETESSEGKTVFARITGDDRIYCGTEVYEELQCERDSTTQDCKKDEAGKIKKQWTEIMVAWPFKQPTNITRSNGDYCSQPALSFDGLSVVYVKTAR